MKRRRQQHLFKLRRQQSEHARHAAEQQRKAARFQRSYAELLVEARDDHPEKPDDGVRGQTPATTEP